MKPVAKFLFTVGMFLGVSATSALAAPVTYVFDPTDPVQYAALLASNPDGITPGFGVSASGSNLLISADGTQAPTKGQGFLLPISIEGDFTARANITLSGAVTGPGGNGFAFLGALDAIPSTATGYSFFGHVGTLFFGFGGQTGSTITQIFPDNNASAVIQVVRAGNTLNNYIDLGSGTFTLMSTHTFSSLADALMLNIGFTTNAPVGGTATLSNITVDYDDGVSVPAPGALLLLGFGLAGLGALCRQKTL